MNDATPAHTTSRDATAGLAVAPVWVVGLLVAAAVVLHWPDLHALGIRWAASPADSHGFLIAAVVPFLVWLARDELGFDRRGRALAVGGLLLATFAWAFARGASIGLGQWLLFPVLVWFAAWIALGWKSARALAFPFGYLLIGMPLWGLLFVGFFQWLTVKACTVLLKIVGTKAYIDGNFVTVPAGSFEIAGGCSGLNFVIVAFATAVLFAYMERLSWRRSFQLVAIALGIAIVANWIRVTAIIVAGDVTQMQTSLVEDHYTFGWYVFAVGMVPFFFVARRIARAEGPTRPAAAPAAPGLAPGTATGALLAGCAALAVAPAWAVLIDRRAAAVEAPDLALPALAGWTGPMAAGFDWQPRFPGAGREVHASFERDGRIVDAYAAFYGAQSAGRKLIGHDSSVAGGEASGWREERVEVVAAPGGDAVREHVLRAAGGRERLVWSWYEVRGARLTSAGSTKLREALAAFGLPARSGVAALSAPCEPDCEAARRTLGAAYADGLSRLSAGTAPAGR